MRVPVATDFRDGRDHEACFSKPEFVFSACSMLFSMLDAAHGHTKTYLRSDVPHMHMAYMTGHMP